MRRSNSMKPADLLQPLRGFGFKEYIGLSPKKKPLLKEGKAKNFSRFVFICGLHRSGTTLIEQYLSTYCESSLLRAPVFENEGQHLQNVYPQAYKYGGPGRFAFHPEMTLDNPESTADVRNQILRNWSPWVVGEGSVLIEKSPPNLTKIDWLRSVFPNSRFLIVTRDPRAVAAATLKWARSSIPELIYHWHVAHSAALASYGDDCLHVKYEDFCMDPVAITQKISETLDLQRRDEPRPMDPRFINIKASNEKYINNLPRMRFGTGCWDRFGYELPQ